MRLPTTVQNKARPMPSCPFGANLEQSVTHCAGVGHAQARAMLCDAFGNPGEAGKNAAGPFRHLSLHGFVEELDAVAHEVNIACML